VDVSPLKSDKSASSFCVPPFVIRVAHDGSCALDFASLPSVFRIPIRIPQRCGQAVLSASAQTAICLDTSCGVLPAFLSLCGLASLYFHSIIESDAQSICF
jgi:hypothetical protein